MMSDRMTYLNNKRKWGNLISHFSFAFLICISHFSFLISNVSYAQDTARRYDSFFLEAICQREKGNSDAAFDLFRHCTQIDSTRSEAWFYLAPYYGALRDQQQSLNCLQRAAEIEPDNETYQETLANAYVNMKKFPEAIAVMERLSVKNPSREDILGALVALYEQEDDLDNAIRTLDRLETLDAMSERLTLAKSDLYSRKGDKKAAIQEIKKLADQYPNDYNYRCMYATTLYQNGQKKKALDIYGDILKEEPENRNALMAMLSHYNAEHDSLKANELLEQMLFAKNTSTDDRVLLLRQVIGESERNGGDSTRVLNLFRQVLELPQNDADLTLFCAAYMGLKKMPEDSIAPVLEKALQIAPDNAAARLQLVGYAWRQEDKDRIIALCQEARQYNPDEMAFYYYQGIAYYQKEQLDNALNAFQNGISVINDQSDPMIVSDFYAVMGDILHQKGLEKEAFAAYDSCLQWKDDNIGCLNNYAYYLSVLGEQLDKAERMSYRTIKAEPKNPTYLDTYAWILFRQERYNEARIYIDQTLQNSTDTSAILLEHAGDIYYHTGDADKAVVLWQQARERASGDPELKGERLAILNKKIKRKKYLRK